MRPSPRGPFRIPRRGVARRQFQGTWRLIPCFRERNGNGSWWATRQVGAASALLLKAVVGVEPLEGRMLLSYLVVVKNGKVIPVHVANARLYEPLYSNGLAVKKQPHFYPYYTGPKTPSLNGVSATAVVSGNRVTDGTLTLSGTVAGPIIANPKNASQEAIYTFAIDRGGAAKAGPFPGPHAHPLRRRGRRPTHARRHHHRQSPLRGDQQRIYQFASDDDYNGPEHLKRHDQGEYSNGQSPTGHLDDQSVTHRPARPSTSGTSTSSHASHRHMVPARTVITALPASPLSRRCFSRLYSMSSYKGDLSLEPRARPHSGARAASIRTWLATNKLGCNQAPWLACSHFFQHCRRTLPDDISLFRRSLALRCIIIPASAPNTDLPLRSGGVPRQQGAVRPGNPVH